ncbi:hypothetical protein Baya_14322 [Bagarius yarrelli]|uniref:Uncharacterized protein n=1 Tax=Bagarius yarrelli TaxID=175774 RepID=A0A556V8V2_BAGYA|nr:hypothetical protein Baya_14322 [Bagarius yarrelli]
MNIKGEQKREKERGRRKKRGVRKSRKTEKKREKEQKEREKLVEEESGEEKIKWQQQQQQQDEDVSGGDLDGDFQIDDRAEDEQRFVRRTCTPEQGRISNGDADEALRLTHGFIQFFIILISDFINSLRSVWSVWSVAVTGQHFAFYQRQRKRTETNHLTKDLTKHQTKQLTKHQTKPQTNYLTKDQT